ncbi:protein ANTAGONIST OF LIKE HETEROCHROMATIN PROTEIN 1 [Ixodes scapularis]
MADPNLLDIVGISEIGVCAHDPEYVRLRRLEEYLLLRKKQILLTLPSPRRWWVRPIWQNRRRESEFHTSMPLLISGDTEYFQKYYKMRPEKFEELHSLVETPLTRAYLTREPLLSRARLAMTLRYLSSGMQIQDIALAFRVGISTAAGVIHSTCKILWTALQPLCLKVPTTERWQEVAEGFQNKWNFPHCVGAVDGKHIEIQAPPNSGSLYYNYKGTYSIVLMAVVDSDLKFVAVDVGAYGRQSDGGTLSASRFGKCLENGLLGLPPPKRLPNSTVIAPYVFLGDEAFHLRPDFLRPYPGKHQDDDKRIFNYRLSRARRCAENAFGVLASRFRIFRRTINLLPEHADYVVMATCALHNYLREDSVYIPPSYVDKEDAYGNITNGNWRSTFKDDETVMTDLEPPVGHNYSGSAREARNLFCSYFMSRQGAVPWQRTSAGLRP